jgi:NADH-quinone oxidoreductase subunit H
MAFGWKRLIPVSLLWIVAVATIRTISLNGGVDRQGLLIGIGTLAVLFLVLFFIPEKEAAEEAADLGETDAFAGGFPVPPMPSGGPIRGAAAALTFDTTVTPTAEEI